MIYVTHDQVEAKSMADKIVVLQTGVIEQVGSPLELYHTPRNKFVAGFIGSPKINLIEGPEAAKHGATTIGIRPKHMAASKTEELWKGCERAVWAWPSIWGLIPSSTCMTRA